MTFKKHLPIFSLFFIIVLCASLLNVQAVRADGETPTEPPPATEVGTELPTEPPVESTPEPVEATPVPQEVVETPVEEATETESPDVTSEEPVSAEESPVAGVLSDVPENTNLVVLNQEGQALALGSQETADAVATSDPVWCPANVTTPTPGANGCSTSYASITELLTAMRTSPADFDEHGTIFLEKPAGQGFTTPLILNDSATSLASSFVALSNYNLTIRGGWNPDNNPTTFSGQTAFGHSGANQGYILIGSETNPWVGDITLQDISISYTSVANAVTVYTTTGDITLINVDVYEQTGIRYTGYLQSDSGNISLDGSSFNGSNQGSNRNRGFYAKTQTGSISVTGDGGSYTFKDALGTASTNYNGATLSAETVTLTNVIARENDGNGIEILNASLVTLTDVVSGPNANNRGNGLSGILIHGTGSTVVNVFRGTFADNGRYGIEISDATLYFHTNPTCPTSGNTVNGSGCYNVPPSIPDTTPPTITPNISGTLGSGGWYTSDVVVSWSVDEADSPLVSRSGCEPTTLNADTAGSTLTCSATSGGGTNSASVTIKRDVSAPVLTLPADMMLTASAPTVVNYAASATDNLDPAVSVACSPASGSTFGIGTTTVSCSSTDEAGNTGSGSFAVTIVEPTVTVLPTSPAPTSTAPAPTILAPGTSSSNSQPGLIVPLTGGELIDLDCSSVFWAFGAKLSFMNLCDQQTTIHQVEANELPGKLPAGAAFMMGLDVDVLSNGQLVESLPEGTGIQMDFPTGSNDEFVVLYWDEVEKEWVEIAAELDYRKVSQVAGDSAADEFYHLVNESVSGKYCQILTTDKTGTFVLVRK